MITTDQNNALRELCHDNARLIEQLISLLSRMTDLQYRQSQAPCDSGIGCHVRHVLDHYDVFFDGLRSGTIDYDGRCRDRGTETQRETATRRLARVASRFDALADSPLPAEIGVIMDCGSRSVARSSVARELQFLVSHTVHHDALIGAAASHMGIALDPGYGVAPSTLRHLGQLQAQR
ncbi:MAG: DinB family protein [Pseudomonadota bacterium]